MSLRIATGGICHESSTLVPMTTRRAEFDAGFGFYRGDEVLANLGDTNVPTGGFKAAARRHNFELLPLLWTFAYPYGVVTADAYAGLKQEFLGRLAALLPIDGVLLDQHGAMVVEQLPDADGDLIRSVREVVGGDCPIVVTTDLHANHTSERVVAADAIIGFETYPHVDQAERGQEAAGLLARLIAGEVSATPALVPVPVEWHPSRQVSGQWPWVDAVDRLHDVKRQPGVLAATLATGFPFADVPHRGPSVIVTTHADEPGARRHAESLVDWIVAREDDWVAPPAAVGDALARGRAAGRHPVIIADQADNPGGGSPGDSTEVLRTFLEMDLQDALLLYMVDPDAVAVATAAGAGSTITVQVGGKSHPAQGEPVEVTAEVLRISDGRFRYDGPMLAGRTGNLGPSAVLRAGGVTTVCVSRREQPLDTAFARSLGIDCGAMRYICVKSAVHFRSGFAALGGTILSVDAAAIHCVAGGVSR